MQRLLHNHNKKVKKKQKHNLCRFENHATKKRTCAHLMSLAQDNGTFIKSHHQQHVICIQTSKLTSFEQLSHLDYFTLIRTANSPRLLYVAVSWLVARWFLGGWWQDDRIPWQAIETIKHIHMIHIYLPFTRKSNGWKSKDVKTVAAEISLINSVPVCIKCL